MMLPGRVHQGFATVAASLWPGIKEALHSLVKDKSSGTAIKHVYVAGHSLGAAVSTLIAYRAR
jgi:triacylglycerol esterase/lipase EstA (alpha/beta hydrolase family)